MKQYNDALNELMTNGKKVGNTLEILNANLKLPVNELCTSKRRLMSPYYLVGEIMFSLDFCNELEFISHYSKFWNQITEGEKVRSAYWWQARYGHGFDQIKLVIDKLTADKNSRQAVIHLKHPIEYNGKDEICTLTLQFFIRDEKLQMIVNMRSNDIILGLPYDHAIFTMLQKYIADEMKIPCEDYYYHNAGSLYLYDRDMDKISDYNDDTTYKIDFDSTFFQQRYNLLAFEKVCRTGSLSLNAGINLIKYNVDGDLAKTVAAIMLMYKKSGEEKRRVMRETLKNVNCGLKQLLVDYQESLRRK